MLPKGWVSLGCPVCHTYQSSSSRVAFRTDSEEQEGWDARCRVMEQQCPHRLTRNTPWMRRVGFVCGGIFAPAVAPLGVAVLFWVSAGNSGLPLPAWFPCPCPSACPPAPFSWASPRGPAAEHPGPTRDTPPGARSLPLAVSLLPSPGQTPPGTAGPLPAAPTGERIYYYFFSGGLSTNYRLSGRGIPPRVGIPRQAVVSDTGL